MKSDITSTARFLSREWKAEYGVTLTRDEVRLVQAHRTLSSSRRQQQHLRRYASALVVEAMSDGRITAAQREFVQHNTDPDHPRTNGDVTAARQWTRDMGRLAGKGGAR